MRVDGNRQAEDVAGGSRVVYCREEGGREGSQRVEELLKGFFKERQGGVERLGLELELGRVGILLKEKGGRV